MAEGQSEQKREFSFDKTERLKRDLSFFTQYQKLDEFPDASVLGETSAHGPKSKYQRQFYDDILKRIKFFKRYGIIQAKEAEEKIAEFQNHFNPKTKNWETITAEDVKLANEFIEFIIQKLEQGAQNE